MSNQAKRYGHAMERIRAIDPDARNAIGSRIGYYKRIGDRLRELLKERDAELLEAREEAQRTIAQLTASIVQLENDYDAVETELRNLTGRAA